MSQTNEITPDYIKNLKHRDVPATAGLVLDVRNELKADIRSLEHKMDARFSAQDGKFSQIDARFNQIDARFSQIDARFSQIDARFLEQDAKLENMQSTLHHMKVLMEEQRAENRVVLDGIKLVMQKWEQESKRMDSIEETVKNLRPPTL